MDSHLKGTVYKQVRITRGRDVKKAFEWSGGFIPRRAKKTILDCFFLCVSLVIFNSYVEVRFNYFLAKTDRH